MSRTATALLFSYYALYQVHFRGSGMKPGYPASFIVIFFQFNLVFWTK